MKKILFLLVLISSQAFAGEHDLEEFECNYLKNEIDTADAQIQLDMLVKRSERTEEKVFTTNMQPIAGYISKYNLDQRSTLLKLYQTECEPSLLKIRHLINDVTHPKTATNK